MANVPFKIDTSEFQKAMREYSVASKKTMAEALSKQALNFTIQSLKYAKKANSSSIRRLEKKDSLIWWTIWQMVKKNPSLKKKELYPIIKKKLADRIRGIGFLRAFFIGMQNAIKGAITKDYSGMKPYFNKATEENKTCEVGIAYDYKKRKESTAIKMEKILNPILQNGMNATVTDMENYVAKKLGYEAKKISSK